MKKTFILLFGTIDISKYLHRRINEMVFNVKNLKWTREPEWYSIEEDKIEIITKPDREL